MLFRSESQIIDKLNERYREEYTPSGHVRHPYVDPDDDLIAQYWEGIEPSRDNMKSLEVLAPTARVIDVIEESRPVEDAKFVLKRGTIKCELNVYDDYDSEKQYTYASDGNTKLDAEAALEELKSNSKIKFVDSKDDKHGYADKYYLDLLPGFEGTIGTMVRSEEHTSELQSH